jgi:hypothetical protein
VRLKNTLRCTQGDELITHFGAEYPDEELSQTGTGLGDHGAVGPASS